MIYYKQEKFSLAEMHFQKALQINPQSSVLLCHIGVVSKSYLIQVWYIKWRLTSMGLYIYRKWHSFFSRFSMLWRNLRKLWIHWTKPLTLIPRTPSANSTEPQYYLQMRSTKWVTNLKGTILEGFFWKQQFFPLGKLNTSHIHLSQL